MTVVSQKQKPNKERNKMDLETSIKIHTHMADVFSGKCRPDGTKEEPELLTYEKATDNLLELEKVNEDEVGPFMDEILSRSYATLEAKVDAVMDKGIDPAKFAAWDLNNGHNGERDYAEMEHKLISEEDLEDLFYEHRDQVFAEDRHAQDELDTYASINRQINNGTF